MSHKLEHYFYQKKSDKLLQMFVLTCCLEMPRVVFKPFSCRKVNLQ